MKCATSDNMTKEDRDALTALLSDPMRLFPEERAAIVGLIGRDAQRETDSPPWTCVHCGRSCPRGARWCECSGEGFPELPRTGGL